jgi:hypothetical protein
MGKNGQYQRLLLSIVILLGEIGAFLLLGALALGVIVSQLLLLLMLSFAPVTLLIGIFPGRGHDFFRAWLGKLVGYLARKVICSLILAVTLAVCQALADATSNLGWLLAFALQATFLWMVFVQRERLTTDLLKATVGPSAAYDKTNRLQTLYYSTRLAQIADEPKDRPRARRARAHLRPRRRQVMPLPSPPRPTPLPAAPPERESVRPPLDCTPPETPEEKSLELSY